MDAALWGVVVGVVLLAAGRAVWLQLRRGRALQEQESDDVFSAVLPEQVGGIEGYLLRFFAEAELSWTPVGALGGISSLIAFLYLLAAIVEFQECHLAKHCHRKCKNALISERRPIKNLSSPVRDHSYILS